MTETWLQWCVKRPGPSWKQGYPGVPSRGLGIITGEIKHSMEGSLAAALGELDKDTRYASWTFSVAKDGSTYQHYPLESVTWHGGSPGANVPFVGIEHEGKVGEPLLPVQFDATVRLSRDIRQFCPKVAASPPQRQVNLWEHNEMTRFGSAPTACPSGRIPWTTIIAGLKEDTTMPTQAEFDALKAEVTSIRGTLGNVVPHLDFSNQEMLDRHLTLQQIEENIVIEEGHIKVTQRLADEVAALLPHFAEPTAETVRTNPHLSLQQIEDHIVVKEGHIEVTQWLADAIAALLPPSISGAEHAHPFTGWTGKA